MAQIHFLISLLFVANFFISGLVSSTNFTFVNKCNHPVWPGIHSNPGSSPFSTTGFALQKGESKTLNAPSSWRGRIWGRTQCTEDSMGNFTCVTGDCGSGELQCPGDGGTAPAATMVEFGLDQYGGMDFYDISLVAGYNLPMLVVPQTVGGVNCTTIGCVVDLDGACPPELKVTINDGSSGACKSACNAFNQDQYCCRGAFSSADSCKPSSYSQLFKMACPCAYSYPFDDATSLFACAGADYNITFCQSPSTSKFSAKLSTASTIFYLNSSLPWYNDTTTNMTLDWDDGSKIRVVLSSRSQPTTTRRPPYNLGFVCGFYCIDSCNEYLFSVIVVGVGNPSVIWSANKEHPVHKNATLQLTGYGDLVLRNSNGTMVWSTNTAGNSALELNITASGNLVLVQNRSVIVWQSFEHPTDTLVNGQKLYVGQKLTSSASKSNWTRGPYYATITKASGFAAYTEVEQGPPLMYYQLGPDQSPNSSSDDGSSYAEFQQNGLLVNLGTSQEIFVMMHKSVFVQDQQSSIRIGVINE